MTFIIDANILFSAFIKPSGVIGSIVFGRQDIEFIAPSFLVKEFYKHKSKIAKAAHVTEQQIERAFQTFLTRLTLYSEDIITDPILATAKDLVSDIDPNDDIYVAFALFFEVKLWSGDKILADGLTRKGVDIIVTTANVMIALLK